MAIKRRPGDPQRGVRGCSECLASPYGTAPASLRRELPVPSNPLCKHLIYHQPSPANVPGSLALMVGPHWQKSALLLSALASKTEQLVLFIRSPTFPHRNMRYIMQSANARLIYGPRLCTNIHGIRWKDPWNKVALQKQKRDIYVKVE